MSERSSIAIDLRRVAASLDDPLENISDVARAMRKALDRMTDLLDAQVAA